jgi:hypothetical protein
MSSLDQERVQQLKEHIENGRHPDSFIPESEQVDDDVPSRPSGRPGVTVAQCNAIRCAAQDDKRGTEIVELFSFVNSPMTTTVHATGNCNHDAGCEPVMTTKSVSSADCRRLREWYETSDMSQRDLADAVGQPRTTIKYHLNGGCAHDHDEA